MRVARLTGAGTFALSDEAVPVPVEGEALVRVAAVGICGSDLHWFEEGSIGDARLAHPLVLGHEFAGVVASGPREGKLVAVDPAIICGRCAHCQEGNPNFCEHGRFAGHAAQDGALREYVAWPEQLMFEVPGGFTAEDAAMLEPLGVAIHAVDLGKIRVGATVGVFGCGPIGLLILAVARAAGAGMTIATDPLPHRVEMARANGATVALQANQRNEASAVLDATNGHGVDVAFEAAGDDDAVSVAMETARSGATIVLAGIPAGDATTFRASTARRKGLTIKLVRRMKHVYPRAIHLVASGLVDVRTMVTHRFPLEHTREAFETAYRRDGGKVMISPETADS